MICAYRYFGIPIVYDRMPEPQRSRLIDLTSNSALCRSEWRRCARYPLRGTNDRAAMCQSFYGRIEAWIDVDPKLALAGVNDIGRYIIDNKREGLPQSCRCCLQRSGLTAVGVFPTHGTMTKGLGPTANRC